MKSRYLLVCFCLSALLLSACGPSQPPSQASQSAEPATASSKDFGGYTVHFSALPTDQLTPEVARNYNITRSKNRAMLNVSILQDEEGTPGKPVAGNVEATATNLTGQLKNLNLRQVIEGDAIYYIGEVAVANRETLVFDLKVTPTNESNTFAVKFSQQFYTD